jgi:hypothetical protein
MFYSASSSVFKGADLWGIIPDYFKSFVCRERRVGIYQVNAVIWKLAYHFQVISFVNGIDFYGITELVRRGNSKIQQC